MIKMYGIPNCDTIKKARKWLEANDVGYEFHDYKKLGVPEADLKKWVKQLGWETILNRKGTTWRKLDDKTRTSVNETAAIKLMLAQPSIIKRPVLIAGKRLIVGFTQDKYTDFLT
jgi:Spx/MgsR family transcriptional regulator